MTLIQMQGVVVHVLEGKSSVTERAALDDFLFERKTTVLSVDADAMRVIPGQYRL